MAPEEKSETAERDRHGWLDRPTYERLVALAYGAISRREIRADPVEIAHIAFLRIMKRAPESLDELLDHHFLVVARSVAIDELRRAYRKKEVDSKNTIGRREPATADEVQPLQVICQEECRERLRRDLLALFDSNKGLAIVAYCRLVEKRTLKEISCDLRISQRTVQRRLKRAERWLVVRLQSHDHSTAGSGRR